MWHLFLHALLCENTATAEGQTTKLVRCESCGRGYAYQLMRTGRGSASAILDWGSMEARQRAAEHLQSRLEDGIDVVPCPACGWYQASMIAKARTLHGRWMVYAGQLLTVGVLPLMTIGCPINAELECNHEPSIPWPVFCATLLGLFIAGMGMFIRKNCARSPLQSQRHGRGGSYPSRTIPRCSRTRGSGDTPGGPPGCHPQG